MEDSTVAERRHPLDRVTAHRLALGVIDSALDDAALLGAEAAMAGVIPQLVRAVGSIAANIAEGYARHSARDRVRYYEYALGSSEEARSWYHVTRRALPADTIARRTDDLTAIRRLLLVMIKNERTAPTWNSPKRV